VLVVDSRGEPLTEGGAVVVLVLEFFEFLTHNFKKLKKLEDFFVLNTDYMDFMDFAALLHLRRIICVTFDNTKVQHFENVVWSYGEIRRDNER
jgi:hypothetical protein